MSDDQLTAKDAAALAEIKHRTWLAYVARETAPPPDGRLGNQNWWWRSTVEKWRRDRPGRGYRTDLHQSPQSQPHREETPR